MHPYVHCSKNMMAIANVTSKHYWTWAASVSHATAAVLPKMTVSALRHLEKPVLNFKKPSSATKAPWAQLGPDWFIHLKEIFFTQGSKRVHRKHAAGSAVVLLFYRTAHRLKESASNSYGGKNTRHKSPCSGQTHCLFRSKNSTNIGQSFSFNGMVINRHLLTYRMHNKFTKLQSALESGDEKYIAWLHYLQQVRSESLQWHHTAAQGIKKSIILDWRI